MGIANAQPLNTLLFLGTRQGVSGSCSRALEAIRSIRQRLGSGNSHDIAAEQKYNFAPYTQPKSSSRCKAQSWTLKVVCLSNMDATRVPCGVAEREMLVKAGLGEKKVVFPNIACSAEEFKSIFIKAFPKLNGCGGFELMRCIPNSKELETISLAISQSPKLLKSVLGGGRVFIRPIQKSLCLEVDEEVFSPDKVYAELYFEVTYTGINLVKVKEKCIHCGQDVPVQDLRRHSKSCRFCIILCLPGSQMMLNIFFRYKVQFDTSSDSDFEDPPAPKTPLISISSDEDSKPCSGEQV